VLALLYLNHYRCGEVCKGFDWDAMSRLHEKEVISDPVVFSEEGEKRARQLFEQMFLVKKKLISRRRVSSRWFGKRNFCFLFFL